MNERQVRRLLTGVLMREGAGVKLHRYIGVEPDNAFEPFLLLDFFDSADPMDYLGGFPDHPHRGFETITYLLHGNMRHRDSRGHEGVVGPGGVQWMTAGRGIIHSEMPAQTEGRLCGIQLWLNLPAADKGMDPAWSDYLETDFPLERPGPGAIIKVIAGVTDGGTMSPIPPGITELLFLDISLEEGRRISQSLPPEHEALLFLLSGAFLVPDGRGARTVHHGMMASLGEGHRVTLEGVAEENRCLLLAAKKLREPIARLGPFVMNTREEVLEAFEDFRKRAALW